VARPSEPVTTLPTITDPSPEPTVNVTAMPATPLPAASTTRTCGAIGTGLFTGADWLSPAVLMSWVGAPAAPIAVNVTAGTPATVAVTVFVPVAAPTRHEPTVATPCAFVVCDAPVS
jgi:hypothetical protein